MIFILSDLNGFAVFAIAGRSFIEFFIVKKSWNVAAANGISTWIYFKIRTILRNMLELDYTNIHDRCCSFSAVLNRLYSWITKFSMQYVKFLTWVYTLEFISRGTRTGTAVYTIVPTAVVTSHFHRTRCPQLWSHKFRPWSISTVGTRNQYVYIMGVIEIVYKLNSLMFYTEELGKNL